MHEMSLQAEEEVGTNCYECYRPVWSSEFRLDEKYFCSEVCMERHLSLLRVTALLCRKVVPPVELPSLRQRASVKKDCGSVRLAAAPITNRSRTSFSSGIVLPADAAYFA
jgi:hypothetical protein